MKKNQQAVVQRAVNKFRRKLEVIYGKKLAGVVLFGSYARGSESAESDVDLAVVLKGKVNPGKEIDRLLDLLVDLNLEHQVLLSVYPISERDFQKRYNPLLNNIRNEGLAL